MKHRSKTVRGFAVLAVAALTVAACGGDDDDDASDEPAEEPADEPAEEPADEPAEEPADEPAEEPADEPAEEPSDEPMEAPEEAPGFDGETITVGIITDQSSPAAAIAGPLANGIQVYFQAYNERNGGVAGQYPIETVVVDNQYNPSVSVQQYGSISDDIAIASIFGTAPTLATLDAIKEDSKIGAPESLDSFWAREANLLPTGAPYQIQAINGLNYHFTEGGGSESDVLCILLQDDAYGEAGLAGVEFAAENLGLEIASEARFTNGDTEFTTQITQLQGDGCTVVWLTSTPSATGGILGKAAEVGFTPMWYGQSPSWLSVLAGSPLAPYMEQFYRVVTEGPEWGDTSVPGMVQMLADLEQYSPDQVPDGYFQFGYNQANAMAALLESGVANGDLSGEGLIAAMETMTTDMGGLQGEWEYGPADTRTPPLLSTVFAVNAELLESTGGTEAIAQDIQAPFAGDFEFVAMGS